MAAVFEIYAGKSKMHPGDSGKERFRGLEKDENRALDPPRSAREDSLDGSGDVSGSKGLGVEHRRRWGRSRASITGVAALGIGVSLGVSLILPPELVSPCLVYDWRIFRGAFCMTFVDDVDDEKARQPLASPRTTFAKVEISQRTSVTLFFYPTSTAPIARDSSTAPLPERHIRLSREQRCRSATHKIIHPKAVVLPDALPTRSSCIQQLTPSKPFRAAHPISATIIGNGAQGVPT
ncbi:hypothetical protein FPV67DRAFT_1455097 [Lyophyllum atratum]|nr:hypothetical protein FPV67DRAFT_1455097 [Lyophyllum atratum]